MKHIFVIHSNICSIVAYYTIEKLRREGSQVIVLLNRNAKWLYNPKDLTIIDISNTYRNHYVYHISSVKDYINRLLYLIKIRRFLNRIVDNKDYILYIPNYGVDYQTFLAEKVNCKGYYFIEEGTLAYTPISYLTAGNKKRTFISRHKSLIGIPNRFYLEITNKFLGTISIHEKAFSWNKKRKIINPTFFDSINQTCYKDIVVTGFFSDEMLNIKNKLSILINYFKEKDITEVAIKFHPHVYYNYPQKIEEMSLFLHVSEIVKFVILPPTYIVELSIIERHSNIYSLDEFSSLNVYSVLFGGFSFVVDDKVREIISLENCIDYITKN